MKLSSLKQWLTLEEASKQMTLLFNEEVEPKDILRLALDRKIQLSIYFRFNVFAKKCVVVDIKDAETAPSLFDPKRLIILGLDLGNGKVIHLDNSLKEGSSIPENAKTHLIRDVYDLPMIGAEVAVVEEMFLETTGESFSEAYSIDAFYVKNDEGDFYQLYEKIEEEITIDESETKKYQEENPDKSTKRTYIKNYKPESFIPLSYMPDNSMLVVRPSAIFKLYDELQNQGKALSQQKERTYQAIIGALLLMIQEDSKPNRNQSAIVTELEAKYKNKAVGFSQKNLEDYFKIANKTLKDKIKEKN